jgi:hypothetical protein
LVGKGWLDSSLLEVLVTAIMGLIAWWALRAKSPASKEAQQIAQAVIDSPTAPNPVNAEGEPVK